MSRGRYFISSCGRKWVYVSKAVRGKHDRIGVEYKDGWLYLRPGDEGGRRIPAPFMDVYGATETLTAMISRHGRHWALPHPLQHVFLVDPKTYAPAEDGGLMGFLDLMNFSMLGAFYPGDVFEARESDHYYGREFRFVRRMTPEEGWDLQRACGGHLEELMMG